MKKILLTFVLSTYVLVLFAQPTGTIVAFGGPKNKVPAGWLLCDGRSYVKTGTYTNLFNAIGTSWGNDGVDKFAVPDLRGLFLRGVSESSNVDVDAQVRTQSRPDLSNSGNSGNNVGSKQGDEVKPHDHPITDPGHSHPYAKGGQTIDTWGSRPVPTGQLVCDHCNDKLGTDRAVTGIVKTEFSSGKESRPKNAYVYYIIKL